MTTKPRGKHKTQRLQLRVFPEFKKRIERAATAAGRNVTQLFEIAMARQLKARPRRHQQPMEARNT